MKITLEIEVPAWANWLAQDDDGVFYVFENEPKPFQNACHWGIGCGEHQILAYSSKANPNWRETLRKIK